MIYTKDNNNIITKNIIYPKNHSKVQEYLKNLSKSENISNSKMFINQALVAPRLQTEHVYFNFDENSINLLERLINSNLSIDTIKETIFNMNNLYDFYLLAYEVLEQICLEPINEYQIDKLTYIDTICESTGVKTEATYILKSIDKAENNAKILELVKKIS